MFLYRKVLRKKLDGPIEPTHAKRPKRLPTVPTRQKALAVIDRLSDLSIFARYGATDFRPRWATRRDGTRETPLANRAVPQLIMKNIQPWRDICSRNSIETCPQDGLKQLFAMGTHRIQLTEPTLRFRHFGAAFARVEEKPVHGAYALA